MSALPTPSIARPLRLRKRGDLHVFRLRFANQGFWGLKDAIALRYFQLTEIEHFVWNSLDGRTSVAEIQQQFNRRFAPLKVQIAQIQQYIGSLYDAGLIISESCGQAEPLLERDRLRRRRELSESILGLLAIRFRGLDGDWLLNPLYRSFRWLFSPYALLLGLALIGAALLLVFEQFPVLLTRLPTVQTFFSVENVVALAAALATTKILHELGHGLACRHFGGECHEIGLMLLFGTPCLYCNVTDAWTFPNKWARIAVSLAGIGIELLLAAVCTLLWWFSEPGWFNAICLNLMIVCSIGTVLINGNPLLRYDAYYVLSDLLEVPNLGPRAARFWKVRCVEYFVPTIKCDEPIDVLQGTILFWYGIASAIYRTVILGGLFLLMYRMLKPDHFESIAWLAMFVVSIGVLRRLWSEIRAMPIDRQRPASYSNKRYLFRRMSAIFGLAAFMFVPLPYRISAPLTVEPEGATAVYVRVSGIVVAAVAEGARVHEGDVIAQLQNRELARDIEQLRGRSALQRLHLENLRRRQSTDAQAAAEIPTAIELLVDLEERLERKRIEEQRLCIRSPVTGIVLPFRQRRYQSDEGDRNEEPRSLLLPENLGCHVEVGTGVCLVGDPDRVEAVLSIDHGDMEFVREGQSVRLILAERPNQTSSGTVVEIAAADAREMSATSKTELSGSAMVEWRDPALKSSRAYRARVAFQPGEFRWLVGSAGRARITVSPVSMGSRFLQFLGRTFRLEL